MFCDDCETINHLKAKIRQYAGGAHRAQALLVGHRVQKQVAWEQRLDARRALAAPLIRVHGQRQEAAKALAFQVLQRSAFLSRPGVDGEPVG